VSKIERFRIRCSHYCQNGHRVGDELEVVLAADHDAAMAEACERLNHVHQEAYRMLNERAEAAEREVERLKAERDKYGWAPVQSHEGWKQRADLAENENRSLRASLDAALEAIGRVRELHYSVADEEDGDWCHDCKHDWPCPTVRAIDGEEKS